MLVWVWREWPFSILGRRCRAWSQKRGLGVGGMAELDRSRGRYPPLTLSGLITPGGTRQGSQSQLNGDPLSFGLDALAVALRLPTGSATRLL